MKHVFDSRSLTGQDPQESARQPDGARAVCGDDGGGRPLIACLRIVVVVAAVSLVLFLVARPILVPILAGTVVAALQALVTELVFGALMRRGRAKTCGERAIRVKRLTTTAWVVEIFLAIAVVLAVASIYSLWK